MRSAIIAAAILALGAAGAVSPAQATIITQLAHGDYANDTANVTFQQAHIVPGEYLSSVTMTISAEGSGGAQVTPDDGFPVYLDFRMSVGITVNGPGIPFKQPFYTDYFDLLSSMDLSGEVYQFVGWGLPGLSHCRRFPDRGLRRIYRLWSGQHTGLGVRGF